MKSKKTSLVLSNEDAKKLKTGFNELAPEKLGQLLDEVLSKQLLDAFSFGDLTHGIVNFLVTTLNLKIESKAKDEQQGFIPIPNATKFISAFFHKGISTEDSIFTQAKRENLITLIKQPIFRITTIETDEEKKKDEILKNKTRLIALCVKQKEAKNEKSQKTVKRKSLVNPPRMENDNQIDQALKNKLGEISTNKKIIDTIQQIHHDKKTQGKTDDFEVKDVLLILANDALQALGRELVNVVPTGKVVVLARNNADKVFKYLLENRYLSKPESRYVILQSMDDFIKEHEKYYNKKRSAVANRKPLEIENQPALLETNVVAPPSLSIGMATRQEESNTINKRVKYYVTKDIRLAFKAYIYEQKPEDIFNIFKTHLANGGFIVEVLKDLTNLVINNKKIPLTIDPQDTTEMVTLQYIRDKTVRRIVERIIQVINKDHQLIEESKSPLIDGKKSYTIKVEKEAEIKHALDLCFTNLHEANNSSKKKKYILSKPRKTTLTHDENLLKNELTKFLKIRTIIDAINEVVLTDKKEKFKVIDVLKKLTTLALKSLNREPSDDKSLTHYLITKIARYHVDKVLFYIIDIGKNKYLVPRGRGKYFATNEFPNFTEQHRDYYENTTLLTEKQDMPDEEISDEKMTDEEEISDKEIIQENKRRKTSSYVYPIPSDSSDEDTASDQDTIGEEVRGYDESEKDVSLSPYEEEGDDVEQASVAFDEAVTTNKMEVDKATKVLSSKEQEQIKKYLTRKRIISFIMAEVNIHSKKKIEVYTIIEKIINAMLSQKQLKHLNYQTLFNQCRKKIRNLADDSLKFMKKHQYIEKIGDGIYKPTKKFAHFINDNPSFYFGSSKSIFLDTNEFTQDEIALFKELFTITQSRQVRIETICHKVEKDGVKQFKAIDIYHIYVREAYQKLNKTMDEKSPLPPIVLLLFLKRFDSLFQYMVNEDYLTTNGSDFTVTPKFQNFIANNPSFYKMKEHSSKFIYTEEKSTTTLAPANMEIDTSLGKGEIVDAIVENSDKEEPLKQSDVAGTKERIIEDDGKANEELFYDKFDVFLREGNFTALGELLKRALTNDHVNQFNQLIQEGKIFSKKVFADLNQTKVKEFITLIESLNITSGPLKGIIYSLGGKKDLLLFKPATNETSNQPLQRKRY